MSSLFFDYPCNFPRALSNVYAWSNTGEPILAVATVKHPHFSVLFFKEDGTFMKEHSIKRVNRKGEAVCMMWHPSQAILACGWDDGVVSLWHMQERISREDNACHRKNKLCMVKWNPDGTRLVSADTDGVIGVWSSDIRGRLLKRQDFNRFGQLTHAVFIDTAPDDARPDFSYFMIAGKLGVVSYANEQRCANVLSLKSPVVVMMEGRGKGEAVIMTESMKLTIVHVNGDQFQILKEVMISAKWNEHLPLQAAWVGPKVLLVSSGEQMLRFWDSGRDINYILDIQSGVDEDGPVIARHDTVTSVDFSKRRGQLVVATKEGHLMMWQFNGLTESAKGDVDGDGTADLWRVVYHKHLKGAAITKVTWGSARHLLAVAEKVPNSSKVVILNETHLQNRVGTELTALQQSPDSLVIQPRGFQDGEIRRTTKTKSIPITCGLSIRGVHISGHRFVVWGSNSAEVYELVDEDVKDDEIKQISTFRCVGGPMAIRDTTLFVVDEGRVDVCNLQGKKQESLSFSEAEGLPRHIHIHGNFMAIATKEGTLKIYDVSRAKARQLGSSARFIDTMGKPLGTITEIKVNCDGTRIAILAEEENTLSFTREPSTHLYVYNSEMNGIMDHDFGPKRYPRSIHWDRQEQKLLACEAVKVPGYVESRASRKGKDDGQVPTGPRGKLTTKQTEFPDGGQITTLFATTGFGLLVQDSFPVNTRTTSLVGANAPQLYFVSADETHGKKNQTLLSKLMRDFVGLDKVDEKTRNALIEFSYRLTIGQMDAAYRAVKAINSPGIWENMLHMCVKTKRLDVAEVCLGNMSHARGAKIVRETMKKETELDACVAMVAIQLGLVKDAEKLYTNCERYDLLNLLYQASGKWKEAVKVATQFDRIHLRTTHFNYARHLESVGDFRGAIKQYERAKAHSYEVPRMMFDTNRMVELEDYINKSHNSKLLRWWGQYTESNSDLDTARRYYELSNDVLSLVRIHCHHKDWAAAEDLVRHSTGDSQKAAAYHLARQYEVSFEADKVKPAMEFFKLAGRYNHAIRLGFEKNMDYDVVMYALESPNKRHTMLAARKFEAKNSLEHAVRLYQNCGEIKRALELCFKAVPPMFDRMKEVAKSLDDKTDPDTLRACSKFFMEHQQYEKAMELCISSGSFEEALDLAEQYKITLTEAMSEGMTMKKKMRGDENFKEHNAKRKKILTRIAALAQAQGEFNIATKKYAEAGNSKEAMVSLLQSGDTKRIITFAGLCRKKECYTLAANYLQQVDDLHEKDDIVKTVIMFYTKGRKFKELSRFYNKVAEFEMNEFRDYDKALDAMQKAVKFMHDRAKDKDGKMGFNKVPKKQDELANLKQYQEKLNHVLEFVKAKKLVGENPSKMIKICEGLLKKPKIDLYLRVGDILALLVEYYDHQKLFEDAMRCIQQMQLTWKLDLSVYLDNAMLERIYKENGQRYTSGRDSKEADSESDEVDDEMDEDIMEEEVVSDDD